MGHLSVFDMLTAVSALEVALAKFGHRFESGAGVATVQTYIKRGFAGGA